MDTAKEPGRADFSEMLSFLKRHRACRLPLVEKTDRLYRNLKDWVSINDLDLEVHFVKEKSEILSVRKTWTLGSMPVAETVSTGLTRPIILGAVRGR